MNALSGFKPIVGRVIMGLILAVLFILYRRGIVAREVWFYWALICTGAWICYMWLDHRGVLKDESEIPEQNQNS